MKIIYFFSNKCGRTTRVFNLRIPAWDLRWLSNVVYAVKHLEGWQIWQLRSSVVAPFAWSSLIAWRASDFSLSVWSGTFLDSTRGEKLDVDAGLVRGLALCRNSICRGNRGNRYWIWVHEKWGWGRCIALIAIIEYWNNFLLGYYFNTIFHKWCVIWICCWTHR